MCRKHIESAASMKVETHIVQLIPSRINFGLLSGLPLVCGTFVPLLHTQTLFSAAGQCVTETVLHAMCV